MRIHRLDVTDLVASLLVAGAATVYAVGAAGADLGGVRARASVVFLLGILACGVGARRDAFGDDGAKGGFIVVLTAVGVVTLVVGATAIILASTGYLAGLMSGIGALWLGATVRHLVMPSTSPTTSVLAGEQRELVKR